MLPVPLYPLKCGTNSYDWGKLGSSSAAAQYAAANGFQVDESKPYAELWMGTHPSNPSIDITSGRTLLELVQENQALLSAAVAERYGQQLPFLFKVLSIRKALSIQAHPDKKLAERLHKEDPKNYPDDNHKPEMTIAITPFDGFCGFRPLQEIASFLENTPELRELVGEEVAREFVAAVGAQEKVQKAALKSLFAAIMTSPEGRFKPLTKQLAESAGNNPDGFAGKEFGGKTLAELIVRLDQQFPEDIGLFCSLVLNYITLQPGEAVFLRANDPHAYLSGDIIECMAASDNVVRAGFTPKFKDVKNLVEMLTYNFAPIEEQKMKPQPWSKAKGKGGSSVVYDPPIEEFAVAKTDLAKSESEEFEGVDGPSIVIVTEGKGWVTVGPKTETLSRGKVFFVGATANVQLRADEEGLVTFRAFCELK
ncbi:mannose-6-phosphate isomerase [Sphaerosporella brunnea]|uniref:Mannose-6-phosphate isomerase n=1 Tax=Sphaerosporella brunnea TaxID=1250544 RepID=A0A5J5EBR2_9PEZI|nr:mannose-6-phosphate isomerase [Sphaerosporella brunnea]